MQGIDITALGATPDNGATDNGHVTVHDCDFESAGVSGSISMGPNLQSLRWHDNRIVPSVPQNWPNITAGPNGSFYKL